MQLVLPEIEAAGATLLAIAPTTPENTEEMATANEYTPPPKRLLYIYIYIAHTKNTCVCVLADGGFRS